MHSTWHTPFQNIQSPAPKTQNCAGQKKTSSGRNHSGASNRCWQEKKSSHSRTGPPKNRNRPPSSPCLCFCSAAFNQDLVSFDVDIGSLDVLGPTAVHQDRTCVSGFTCLVDDISGLLVGEDRLLALSTCAPGSNEGGAAIRSRGSWDAQWGATDLAIPSGIYRLRICVSGRKMMVAVLHLQCVSWACGRASGAGGVLMQRGGVHWRRGACGWRRGVRASGPDDDKHDDDERLARIQWRHGPRPPHIRSKTSQGRPCD